MNEYARCRDARLTLPVHIHALYGGCRGLFGVGIRENYNRILAAAHALEIGRSLFGDGPAARNRSDQADAAYIRMPHQGRAGLAVAGEYIDHPAGEYAVAQFAESQAR